MQRNLVNQFVLAWLCVGISSDAQQNDITSKPLTTVKHPIVAFAAGSAETAATTQDSQTESASQPISSNISNASVPGEENTSSVPPLADASMVTVTGDGNKTSTRTHVADADETTASEAPRQANVPFSNRTSAGDTPAGGKIDNKKIKTESAAGYVILVLIGICIAILCCILYILRARARSYSFDLSNPHYGLDNDHDTPLKGMERDGTFEQTTSDPPMSQEFVQEEKLSQGNNTGANGYQTDIDEKTSSEQHNDGENSFGSDISLTPPIKKVGFKLDLNVSEDGSTLTSPTTSDCPDRQHNENNNNVSHTVMTYAHDLEEEVFTEISLGDMG